ncbi:MAG: ABC transporter ATP-binding protein [bacterium]
MEKPIIEVKNIGKKYNIIHQRGGYVALRDVLANTLKSPFSFLKNKAKQIAGLETKEDFWALRDINFTVNKGEIIGIIGKNGAGKSTLLKILSQITPPTTGEIKMHGRVGSLLEVGTGFHPELSGRENIFLNGAILGMTKKEIAEKFDKIVEFSGIGKFLDTPVKHYSSGMYVRLAFSVAAHMEPDILIIDEVLAVGDAEFQKKCLGKMDEITKKDGRTIIFVSHDIKAIEQLCNKCILLESGKIKTRGETKKVTASYLNTRQANTCSEVTYTPNREKDAQITKISILNNGKVPSTQIQNDENFSILIEYEVYKKIDRAVLCAFFFEDKNFYLASTETDNVKKIDESLPGFEIGRYKTNIEIPSFVFKPGFYSFQISIQRPFQDYYADNKTDLHFEVTPINKPKSMNHYSRVKVEVSPVLKYITEMC